MPGSPLAPAAAEETWESRFIDSESDAGSRFANVSWSFDEQDGFSFEAEKAVEEDEIDVSMDVLRAYWGEEADASE